ncbi:TlpA family protein disulfide reductase [Brumimicrobium mesophilum]|uniref:TlpA family protein disulfide reductase n=1 Tax=Brumimicrobium mesophilum TaxID=392717 RepID=UPI000D143E58|nr:redoxin domain-containing protein [Brumimicrobium mesophilum]
MFKVFAFLFFITLSLFVVAQPVTTLQGVANTYVGKEVKVFIIEDYLSQIRTQIASSVVQADSSFELSFYNTQTRKIRIEVDENYFHIYAQPKADYNLFVGENSPYVDQNAKAVEVEFYFLDLDSTDINYKILMFEDLQFNFLEANYNPRAVKSTNFVGKLDTFKVRVTEKYKGDTSNFFKTYVKFSIASLDDLAFVGQRNEYEKFDFYIKPETVWYQNDRYMSYILHYFKMYERQLPNKVNEKFYEAVIQSSPSLAINALGGDYSLKNIRLRELIMLKMLSEVFYTDDYPKTNILTMLDSVSNHALFHENKIVSSNLKYRLLDLVPGTKMPDFSLKINGEKKYQSDYSGKHVYIQFVNKDMKNSIEDMPLLYKLQQKYSKNTQFLTVLVVEKNDDLLEDPTPFVKQHNIAWDFSVISKDNDILKKLNVSTYPHYLLMDAQGVVVAAPALTPRPNNEYETIELVLIQINRRINAMEGEVEKDWR